MIDTQGRYLCRRFSCDDPLGGGFNAARPTTSVTERVDAVMDAYSEYRLLALLGSLKMTATEESLLQEWAAGASREDRSPDRMHGPELPPLPHPAALRLTAPEWTLQKLMARVDKYLREDLFEAMRERIAQWADSSEYADRESFRRLVTDLEDLEDKSGSIRESVRSGMATRSIAFNRIEGTITLFSTTGDPRTIILSPSLLRHSDHAAVDWRTTMTVRLSPPPQGS